MTPSASLAASERNAHYLLRLDDFCPTCNQPRWRQLLGLIHQAGVRPILAVVPDNQDPDLIFGAECPEFWPWVRELEAAGATIALHGYRHLPEGRGGGLLPMHHFTEFAGVDPAWQRAWIEAGLKILRSHGLTPRLWIAPRHGQDHATLHALLAEGITALSDGFARLPYRRCGITWLPQQLWGLDERGPGLWTVCLHPNTMSEAAIEAFGQTLSQRAHQFLSFDQAMAHFPPSAYHLGIAVRQRIMIERIRMARFRSRFRRRLLR